GHGPAVDARRTRRPRDRLVEALMAYRNPGRTKRNAWRPRWQPYSLGGAPLRGGPTGELQRNDRVVKSGPPGVSSSLPARTAAAAEPAGEAEAAEPAAPPRGPGAARRARARGH